jgi:hypothetical protein
MHWTTCAEQNRKVAVARYPSMNEGSTTERGCWIERIGGVFGVFWVKIKWGWFFGGVGGGADRGGTGDVSNCIDCGCGGVRGCGLWGWGGFLVTRPDLVPPFPRRAKGSRRFAMSSRCHEMREGLGLGAGLEACTTRGAWKYRGGHFDEGGCAVFHGVPLPAIGSASWELLEGSISRCGRGCKIFVCILFGYYFGAFEMYPA